MKEVKNTASALGRVPESASDQAYNPALYPGPGAVSRVRPVQTRGETSRNAFRAEEGSLSENGFNFVGVDSLDQPVKGFVQTTDEAMVSMELERAGIRVQSITPRSGGRTNRRSPKRVEFAALAEQFGDLMEIGESPTQICRLLAYSQTNQVLSEALFNAADLIINGRSLSEAFAAQLDSNGEPLFPVTFICALRIGEEVGTAADTDSGDDKSAFLLTLYRFAEAEKKAAAIRSSIRSALMYPVAVVAFCLVAVGIVEYFVMPKMVELYNSLLTGTDTQLPYITQIMIAGSDFLTSWLGIAFVGIVLIASIVFVRWTRSKEGSDWLKVVALRLPVFGPFFRHYFAAETLRTLAMLSAGIPSMTERFLVAAETANNPEYARMLRHVRHRFITESTDLHKLFVPYPFLMGKEFSGVLLTFEKTADMQNTFHNYAEVVETRAQRELDAMLFWLQNFAIVPVGIFVGFIVAALYSPMFEIAGRLGQGN